MKINNTLFFFFNAPISTILYALEFIMGNIINTTHSVLFLNI